MHELNLKAIEQRYADDLKSVSDWCDETYAESFQPYFKDQRALFSRLKSKSRTITDAELEWILTEVPVNLFEVAESISALQTSQEVLKLSIKRREADIAKVSTESSESKRKEYAALETIDDKILLLAYGNLLTRVEKEMSYSRELIMSAKKIWDARKRTEESNPVSEISPTELPEYNQTKCKSYIG